MANVPEFYMGDTRKPLRVTLKNNSAPLDLTGGNCRLFATGIDSNNKPTSNVGEGIWNGVLGVIIGAPTNGVVEFQALGSLLNVGAARRADRYRYQVKFVDSGMLVLWSVQSYFIGRKQPS